VGIELADDGDHLGGVHVGQVEVEDDDVRLLPPDHLDAVEGTHRRAHHPQLRVGHQEPHDALQDHLVIVDDDDTQRRVTHDRSRAVRTATKRHVA